MAATNTGICHSCRKPGHFLSDCPTKKECPVCGKGIEKCMAVLKNTPEKGKLFYYCTRDCGHFKWKDNNEPSSESSNGKAVEETEHITRLFEKCAQITVKNNVEINVNITFRKGKGVAEVEGKKGNSP